MPFFGFSERLYLRIPAAVGLLCVGFWRRVGVSTVFCEVFFFFIFFLQHVIVHFFLSKSSFVFFCQNLIRLFCQSLILLSPLSIFANFRLILLENRPKYSQISLNVHFISPETLLN
jgi:hypothetical protein